jgi:hypothetical protein
VLKCQKAVARKEFYSEFRYNLHAWGMLLALRNKINIAVIQRGESSLGSPNDLDDNYVVLDLDHADTGMNNRPHVVDLLSASFLFHFPQTSHFQN